MNRKERRAAKAAGQTPLPQLNPEQRARVAAVFPPLVEVSAPEYSPKRDENRVTADILDRLKALSDDELAVASSTAEALHALCGAVMTARLAESFAAAVMETEGAR